jgi:hypothetical protein
MAFRAAGAGGTERRAHGTRADTPHGTPRRGSRGVARPRVGGEIVRELVRADGEHRRPPPVARTRASAQRLAFAVPRAEESTKIRLKHSA